MSGVNEYVRMEASQQTVTHYGPEDAINGNAESNQKLQLSGILY